MRLRLGGQCSLLLAAIAFCVLIPIAARTQVVGTNLSGTVTDSTGAVLPNASVAIKNVATGLTRMAETDRAGLYVAPNLLPGNYEVTISARGFQTQVQNGIVLTVGAQQTLNVSLRVGQAEAKIEVTATEPAVDLTSSSLGGLVNSRTVRELPLNGRSWTDLATLQPGVTALAQLQYNYATGSQRAVRGFGDQISVSGGRPQWNNYRLDGVSINDFSNGGPGSVLGGNLGVDAIQEFSMLTSNYSAEYGRTAGGVINAITRSGTNDFHGAVYEFLRNSALDARNYFDPAKIPPFRRNQFGADGGGPIKKNKLFVFADYEGVRQSKSISSLQTVPSAAARSGQLCSVPSSPTACKPHAVTVDSNVQKFLPLWPLPNAGALASSNGDIGDLILAAPQVVDENFLTTRGDYKLSEKDSLDATYLRDFTNFTTPSPLNTTTFGSVTNRQVATLEDTHVFSPRWVNSVRFGFNREAAVLNEALGAIDPLAADSSLSTVPGHGAATINITGLTSFAGGVGTPASALQTFNDIQTYDNAFWTHGKHSIKFGGAVERIQDNETTNSTGGIFNFSSLQNFLTNVPKSFSNRSNVTLEQGFRQTLLALYLDDDWRVRPNLTVNAGLRYETISAPSEVNNKLATLLNLPDATPHLGSPLYSNPTRRNFEPRVGFAWDPFKTGKTSIRSGFGIFDVLPLPIELINTENKAAPFAQGVAASKLPQGAFPFTAFTLVGPSTSSEAYYQQNHPRSYVMQYNLSLQRALPGGVTATVGYAGSGGVHLPFRSDDTDTVMPTLTPGGYIFPSPIGSGTKINPHFGQVLTLLYDEKSNYNALQVAVQKALSHGLQLNTSFTWGKSFDSGSSTGSGDQFLNAASSSLPFYDLKGMYGLSDFNVTRSLIINAIWVLPTAKSLPGAAAWIANGWQLGAIYKASDGIPFSATFGTNGDPLGMNSSNPVDFADVIHGPGCGSLVNPSNPTNYVKTQCFTIPSAPSQAFYNQYCDSHVGTYPQCFNLLGHAGRNTLIGPGLSNFDFSLYKNNYVTRFSETFNVQFRVEAFNILNRTNFNFPSSTDVFLASGAPNPAAGLLTSTATDARQLQFAMKVMW